MESNKAVEAHPAGLQTLFFTEMWERLSYYGMRALLVLFMVDSTRGGLGLSDREATSIYGLYTAGVYFAALPGGWIADRILGGRRAVWWGGVLIALGHFTLALPGIQSFYAGLLLVVAGTGLLKPNISAMVGGLYPEGGARRDAGFTLFYMGINLGAAIGPLICSTLGEKVHWHAGFAAAGVGMVAGLIQYRMTEHRLGAVGLEPTVTAGERRADVLKVWVVGGLLVSFAVLALLKVAPFNPVWVARNSAVAIATLAVAYFVWAFFGAGLNREERKRLGVIAILFVSSMLFWSGFEQAGSSLNLFAERYTTRALMLGASRWEIPAGWFQSINSLILITLAPATAAGWMALARKGWMPSLAVKAAWGLILLGAGFLVLAMGAKRALSGGAVWPTWLLATYFLHTVGELLISPVGLSSVTKLAPTRLVGQMMGIWFLATSMGNLVAGLFAAEVTGDQASQMPARFLQVVGTAGGAGVLLLMLAKPIRSLMKGVN